MYNQEAVTNLELYNINEFSKNFQFYLEKGLKKRHFFRVKWKDFYSRIILHN